MQTLSVVTPATTKDLTVLATLKTSLGISGSAEDAKLADIIRQASDRISSHCRRPEGFGVETVAETWRLMRVAQALILSRDIAPVISSVVEDGTTLSASDYLLDGLLLRRLVNDVPTAWTADKVVVTYTAGYGLLTALPYDLERACLDLCATMRAGDGRDRTIRSEQVEGVGSTAYLDPGEGETGMPMAIAEALCPYERAPFL